MKYLLKISLVSLLSLVILSSAYTQKKEFNTIYEAIYSSRNLQGSLGPSDIVWIKDGEQYSYTKNTGGAQEIWIHVVKTGNERLVFTTKGKKFHDGSDFRYRTFQWTADSKFILFQTKFTPVWRYSGNSDYYYYSIENETLKLVVEQAFTAEVSPDGSKLGYGKDGELYMFTFANQETTRFTNDAEPYFYNGRWGWAYEEEFGLVQAWKWSHDSKYIAFWQSDERHVPIYQLTDFSGMHPEYMEVPYPKVGDPAPSVKIGVIDTGNGDVEWIDFDLAGGYIPRIYWTSEKDKLALIYMNRQQNLLEVHMVNVSEKNSYLAYTETSDSWIDIFDFFAGELDHFYFPESMDSFFFVSERDGWAHIYQISYDGKTVSQLTGGEYEVIGIKAINTETKKIYYLSTEVSPLERNLFVVNFNGKNKKRITSAAGNHSVNVSPDGTYFFDTYSSVSTPARTELKSTGGKLIMDLTDNSAVEAFLESHVYAPKELFSFTTSDGQQLDGYFVRPINFDTEKKYPLILDIYGGPGSQNVFNEFETDGMHQWFAQQGFVVADINNRGNGGYGGPFEKIVYGQLGKVESEDFVEAAKYLAGLPWIDGDRMAIKGHSYGGFMSSYTMVNHPGVFKASIVAAPNADHRLYDCILTERLMGLIEDNEEGYINSAVSTNADKLEGKMLLVHSLLDDNVHPQHTFQLVSAFIQAGKDIELKIYPQGNHGVAYDGMSYLLLLNQYTDFLIRNLK